MELTSEIRKALHRSVLCWLATATPDGMPNVSPKEVFAPYANNGIIIANIASPRTVRNIKKNNNVSLSFIDVLAQKGFQLKGKANLLKQGDEAFSQMEKTLVAMTKGQFPFRSITHITITHAYPIVAPRYHLFPETTEEEQIARAKKVYGM